MKLLFISQWCYPEPDARIFFMARELVKRGHQVQILTGFPNYPGGKIYDGYKLQLYKKEIIEGVEIKRVWLFPSHDNSAMKRTFNYFSYAFSASIIGLFLISKPDIIYVYHPPTTAGIPAIIFGKLYRAKIVYDIQDLWPDSLIATSMVSNNQIINLVNLIQRFIYKNSNSITVISKGFKSQLEKRGISENKINIIRNWSIPLGHQKLEETQNINFNGKFVLMFAGNLGKAQGLSTVIDAAKIIQDRRIDDILVVFLGSGATKQELIEYSKSLQLNNISFLERVLPDKVGAYLRKADVLLIHLTKDPLFAITIPSKIQSYLMMGKPILAGIEGDAAEIIEESGAGYTFAPENSNQLVSQLIKIKNLSDTERYEMGVRGKKYYDDNLAFEIGVSKFERLFENLLSQK